MSAKNNKSQPTGKAKKLQEDKKECPGTLASQDMKEFCLTWSALDPQKWELTAAIKAWRDLLIKQHQNKCPEHCQLRVTITLVDLGAGCAEADGDSIVTGRWVKGKYTVSCIKQEKKQ